MEISEIANMVGVVVASPDPTTADLLQYRQIKNHKGEVVGTGAPLKTSLNLEIVLSHDPTLQGAIRYNEFSKVIEYKGEPIKDQAETDLMLWIARTYDLEMPTKRVSEVMALVADKNPTHPVRDWLDSVEWDNTPRLESLLSKYFGAKDSDLVREIGLKWGVGCVARIYQPGCKLDTVLVIQGPQGARKSTAFRKLTGNDAWFSDTLVDFRNKDAYQQLQGVWIYELAELDNVKRSDIGAIKAFLSAQVDKYRPSYGRHVQTYPRSTAFVGSTNDLEFLPADPTGSRRFWPVKIGHIDIEAIDNDRDQLWAEAVSLYKSGTCWWLEGKANEDLIEVSQEYRQHDSWEVVIEGWLRARFEPFTLEDVLRGALKKDPSEQSRYDGMRAAALLTGLGCVKRRMHFDGARRVMWARDGEILDMAKGGYGKKGTSDK